MASENSTDRLGSIGPSGIANVTSGDGDRNGPMRNRAARWRSSGDSNVSHRHENSSGGWARPTKGGRRPAEDRSSRAVRASVFRRGHVWRLRHVSLDGAIITITRLLRIFYSFLVRRIALDLLPRFLVSYAATVCSLQALGSGKLSCGGQWYPLAAAGCNLVSSPRPGARPAVLPVFANSPRRVL